ncbi:DUF2809 domain-containing protein [Kitasatospora sp. NPDC057198]|uniref:ribosomal maturation YjgA family protein n=1 Tax=Kitasatospora sp. NPDC057198 TaxID=3346046 RepID=UPI0036290A15
MTHRQPLAPEAAREAAPEAAREAVRGGPPRSAESPGERRARVGWLAGAGAVLLLGLALPALVPAAAAALLGGALYTALLHTVLMAAAPRLGPWTAAGTALAASWAVELFQASGLPADLGEHSRFSRLLLGTTFDLPDLLGYAIGAAAVLAVHRALRGRARRRDRGQGYERGRGRERRPARRFDAPEVK